jgi:polyhydroxybutyrate depolymerase
VIREKLLYKASIFCSTWAAASALLLMLNMVAVCSAAAKELSEGDARQVRVGGLMREFIVHVPPVHPASKVAAELPLVFVFHGGGGVAAREDKLSHFASLAQRERFVVVYPQGIGQSWNDGRDTTVSQAHRDKIDDLAFFDAMLALLSKEMIIDANRIYATGISNGAIFSHYLAANRAGQIAAIAPVAGGIAEPFYLQFKPTHPVSVLIIQGTEDPFVPYAGGRIMPKNAQNRGKVIPTDDAIKLWTTHNRTKVTPHEINLPNLDPNDGCLAKQLTWASGYSRAARAKRGPVVQLLLLEGGGHTWPSGPQYLPASIIGRVCNDFDATAVIWDFFKTHPKQYR